MPKRFGTAAVEAVKTLTEREGWRRKRAEKKGRFVYPQPTKVMMLKP